MSASARNARRSARRLFTLHRGFALMKNINRRNSISLLVGAIFILAATATASRQRVGSRLSRDAKDAGIKKNLANETAPARFSRVLASLHQPVAPQTVGLTFVVTNTNDSGPGSLRQAITDSNNAGSGPN